MVFMKYYSYEDFKTDTNMLIEGLKIFNPQAIVAIARGGLSLSHAVAEGLNIRNTQFIRTELYDQTQKRKNIAMYGTCTFTNIQKVVVLDDIADSGETLQTIMDDLQSKHPDVEFQSATLFYKKTSCYEPDLWINEAKEWINFFWEKDFNSVVQ